MDPCLPVKGFLLPMLRKSLFIIIRSDRKRYTLSKSAVGRTGMSVPEYPARKARHRTVADIAFALETNGYGPYPPHMFLPRKIQEVALLIPATRTLKENFLG